MAKPPTARVAQRLRSQGFTVYNRSQWGSKHGALYDRMREVRPVNLPVNTAWQHITVTFDTGRLPGPFKADVRRLEDIGMQRFGWGISYNWIVDQRTGHIAIGVPVDAAGTHTVNRKGIPGFSYDQNRVSVSIAWLGMPGDPISDNCVDSIEALLIAMFRENVLEFRDIRGNDEHFDYGPHSLVAAKECPTQAMRNLMPGIERRVRARL